MHLVLGNIPAAYFACEGLSPGDTCRAPGPSWGACVVDTLCDDDAPNTPVNECMLCVDPCWGGAPGDACVQPDGSDGMCRAQEMCTDKPETSFAECVRCEQPDQVEPEAGCSAVDGLTALPWLLILLVGAAQLRRPRRREPR